VGKLDSDAASDYARTSGWRQGDGSPARIAREHQALERRPGKGIANASWPVWFM